MFRIGVGGFDLGGDCAISLEFDIDEEIEKKIGF